MASASKPGRELPSRILHEASRLVVTITAHLDRLSDFSLWVAGAPPDTTAEVDKDLEGANKSLYDLSRAIVRLASHESWGYAATSDTAHRYSPGGIHNVDAAYERSVLQRDFAEVWKALDSINAHTGYMVESRRYSVQESLLVTYTAAHTLFGDVDELLGILGLPRLNRPPQAARATPA